MAVEREKLRAGNNYATWVMFHRIKMMVPECGRRPKQGTIIFTLWNIAGTRFFGGVQQRPSTGLFTKQPCTLWEPDPYVLYACELCDVSDRIADARELAMAHTGHAWRQCKA